MCISTAENTKKGGIQQEDSAIQREDINDLLQVQNHKTKARTATAILNSEEVNFKEFEMSCSLVDTGTG